MRRLTFNRNNIFDPIFNDSIVPGTPPVNIIETDTHYHVELKTLGFKRKDFMIHLDRKILNISIEKKLKKLSMYNALLCQNPPMTVILKQNTPMGY